MLSFTMRTLALRRGRLLDPVRVAELQRRRLRSLVRRAVEGTAFYREKYRGIDPDRFTLADLPPTNKGELMANFDRAVTDPEVSRAGLVRFMDDPANADRLYLGRYVASHTSGSQGQPLLLIQDERCVELFFGLQMTRGNSEPVNVGTALRHLFRPKRLAVVTLKRGLYPSATLFQHMPASVRRYVDLLWISQTDPDMVERLNAFRPRILTGYAGILEILALEAEAGRLRLAPELRQVVSNSEALTDRAKARIESAFGLHAMNNYATGECPFLSNGCPTDDGAHVNADRAILEVVDHDYRPVPDGTPGSKVLITNLANAAQPIIRYEVGDVVTMADVPCRCGSRLPRVARIGGRAADVFWVGEGRRRRQMVNMVLSHAFEYLRDVREWQAIQTAPDRILVRLEPLPGATLDLASSRPAVDRELALHDFQDVRVDFEVVPRLSPDPATGKFRRMISQLGRASGPSPVGVEDGLGLDPISAASKAAAPARH
jgi:phenylacetate-coenzyme A ligase PaaK-like adenylate-forming protein